MPRIPMLRRNDGVNCNASRFPDDFTIVGHFLCDERDEEFLCSLPPRCWGLLRNPRSRSGYACYRLNPSQDSETRLAHVVVWERHNGPIPINEETGKRFQVDHINQDGLDNRLENLRLATSVQQAHNAAKRRTYGKVATSSQFKGVTWDSNLCKWIAQIRAFKKRVHLGVFALEHEAAYASNVAMSIAHDVTFAITNEVPPDSISPARRRQIEADVARRIAEKAGVAS